MTLLFSQLVGKDDLVQLCSAQALCLRTPTSTTCVVSSSERTYYTIALDSSVQLRLLRRRELALLVNQTYHEPGRSDDLRTKMHLLTFRSH